MENQLKELLVERLFLDLDPQEIDSELPLSDYGIDSFLLLEMIVAIEELFEIKFERTDITAETLRSIASLQSCIETKQKEKNKNDTVS